MVDYSKWDSIDLSDEEEQKPKVTKLEQGSRITFGNGTVHIETPKEKKDREINQQRYETEKAKLVKNGCDKGTYLWTQTKTEVIISVIVPQNTRARDVKCKISREHLTIVANGKIIIDELFAYPVHDDEDALLDPFNVEDFGEKRIIKIELQKALPGDTFSSIQLPGSSCDPQGIIWWDKCFKSDTAPISVTSIPDRDKSERSLKQQAQWKESWEKAHEMFRESIKKQKPVVLGGEQ